ncbi:hypothetical protein NLI96_g2177 [Meripilus lineatus]|uniref:F-box domain-containing protein n=1 Tax=Meripilus lineatus TaxID=2056292 RepID=A0AAD5VEK0_9APHY|nr:hypothetical protein NLI96_g2177 [Physisporinus lineatus]
MSTFPRGRWTSTKLPLEVCESIIGFMPSRPGSGIFSTQRRRSLFSCLLVCRDWVPKSRIELYRYILLNNKRQAISFVEIVTAFPSLGNYVRALRLDGSSDVRGDPANRCIDWLYKVHHLRFPNIIILQYHSLPAVHPVFFSLSRFQSVTRLSLSNLQSWSIRETARFLNRFPRLEDLVISSCYWGQDIPGSVYGRKTVGESAPSTVSPHFELIESLMDKGKGCKILVGWLAKSNLSSSLCSMELWVDLTTAEGFSDLLNQCSGTLESLQLQVSCLRNYPGMEWMEVVSVCKKLRTFGFCLLDWELEEGNLKQVYPPPPHLLFLETLAHLPKSLRNFSLYLPLNKPITNVFTNPISREFWAAFDDTLGGPKFSHLTRVELLWGISPHSVHEFVIDLRSILIKGEFKRRMPYLYEREIFYCGHSLPSHEVYPISALTDSIFYNWQKQPSMFRPPS